MATICKLERIKGKELGHRAWIREKQEAEQGNYMRIRED